MVIKFKSCTLAFQSFYHLTFPWSIPLPTLIVWFQYPIQQPNWPIFLGHPISRSQPKLFPSMTYPCPPSSIPKCPNPAHLWKVNSNTDLYDIIPDSLCRSDFASLLTHDTSCQLFLDLITYYHVLLLCTNDCFLLRISDPWGQRLCLIHHPLHRANSRAGHWFSSLVTWTNTVPTLRLDLFFSKQIGGDDL